MRWDEKLGAGRRGVWTCYAERLERKVSRWEKSEFFYGSIALEQEWERWGKPDHGS